MKYLIVNGMDESHDLEHEKANSQFQYTFFKEIIEQTDPNAKVRVLHTYLDDINSFSYDDYDVFMWTGGLGNIYLSNQHNQNQLKVCEKILKLDKPLWGSCWGLQVIATCYGDKIIQAGKFEFGFAENIEIIKMDYTTTNYIFQSAVSFVLENRIIAGVLWIAFMFFILRKIAKRDNDFILKKFSKFNK